MPTTDPQGRVLAALDRLTAGFPGRLPSLGIAFSGGGDSTALLAMAAEWAKRRGIRIMAATVDHRLRPESADEARRAGLEAARLGVPHRVLVWPPPHPPGNISAMAREARLRLLSAWAREEGLAAIALGHTRDDVAETLLMRLERGAGLDGLAAMAERREAEGMLWLRPMLSVGRAELRDWLISRALRWVEDPTNEDPAHDRARIRQAIAMLGLDSARIADSAMHLRTARETLGRLACDATSLAAVRLGMLTLPQDIWTATLPELRRLILIAVTRWITGAPYPPRAAATAEAMETLESGQMAQLGGTLIRPGAKLLKFMREPAAAARAAPLVTDGVWDNRWRVTGLSKGLTVRALGDAAARIDRQALDLPLAAARSMPALWDDGHMVASLLPTPPAGMTIAPLRGQGDFRRLLAEG